MARYLMVLLGLALAAPQAAAQSPQDGPTITAQGEASVKHAPDVAWVQIAVEARGAKPGDARERAAETMTSVIDTLKRQLPADAIRTSGFSVQPEMDYSGGNARVRDYVARNQVEARVDDLDRLAGVLDASVTNGATSIGGVRFDVKTRPQLERDALKAAVQDATERAQAMAAGANRSLGPLIRIQEQRLTGNGVVFRTMSAGAGRGGAGTETPIVPGEIEIRAQVTLTVGIR